MTPGRPLGWGDLGEAVEKDGDLRKTSYIVRVDRGTGPGTPPSPMGPLTPESLLKEILRPWRRKKVTSCSRTKVPRTGPRGNRKQEVEDREVRRGEVARLPRDGHPDPSVGVSRTIDDFVCQEDSGTPTGTGGVPSKDHPY